LICGDCFSICSGEWSVFQCESSGNQIAGAHCAMFRLPARGTRRHCSKCITQGSGRGQRRWGPFCCGTGRTHGWISTRY
jgi:hypothetical protein